jgi:hypothetical protein
MPDDRVDPPGLGDERTMLTSFLDYYRRTLVLKAEGLTDEQARTPSVEPSDLNLTGLIRHMAEVERNWFQRWMRGAEDAGPLFYGSAHPTEDPDGDLHPGPDDTLAAAIAALTAEIEAADAVIRSNDLAQPARHERNGFRPNLRWVMVHMIEEYARHCGHADLVRQRLDGTTGD